MNCPNKQEDIKIFLQQQRTGLVGFLETKVKEQNIPKVLGKICPNWQYTHNATAQERGRVIVCWHPRHYMFSKIQVTDQSIHGEAIQLSTNTKFLITFIYGRNQEDDRGPLWMDIRNQFISIEDPWCILGDFNAVLHQGDRIGGVDVNDSETRDFAECIHACNLQEFQYERAFFT